MSPKSLILKLLNRNPPPSWMEEELRRLRYESNYLQLEVSRLRSLVRYLVADVIHDLPMQRQTKQSFDFQWASSSDGNWMVNHPEIREREPALVCKYTGLPKEWFAGKKVLDAGCGSGRFSWAMASMGATVVALDQSPAGLQNTLDACSEFGGRVTGRQQDLTQPIELESDFDLVWSFGVLHHTGNTFGAFSNVQKLVKPGGSIFLMLYGEPTGAEPGEFVYYYDVEKLRRHTVGMSFDERMQYLQRMKGDDAGGWFDAVSPEINDTYSFYEIQLWLQRAGFTNIRRTIESSSHHVMADRPR
jgi:2-polyprenyl-3-methyl-5-hydroxy-6-metoxy-1,4-benzoquinol methylase